MCVDDSIAKYDHPYLTADGVLFRVKGGRLEVKLYWNPDRGFWCLPGGFVSVDRLAEDVLREKMAGKSGASGFYAEQLRTYDALDRDPRGRVVSVAYLCLTADQAGDDGWFVLDGGNLLPAGAGAWAAGTVLPGTLDGLGFDHGAMIADARERLVNKLWYSDLARYLLPQVFRLDEIQGMYEMLEGKDYYGNFKRNMGGRLVPVGTERDGKPGRKAVLYEWNNKEA